MNIAAILTIGALFVLLAISCVLIFWNNYEDGIVGKSALIVIAMTSFAALLDSGNGYFWRPEPVITALVMAMAAFLSRHFYRFIRFTYGGRYGWKRQKEH